MLLGSLLLACSGRHRPAAPGHGCLRHVVAAKDCVGRCVRRDDERAVVALLRDHVLAGQVPLRVTCAARCTVYRRAAGIRKREANLAARMTSPASLILPLK